jgi:hypothetical protein
MYPFRTLPDTIDGVICGNCGLPVWDHYINNACRSFALHGFVALAVDGDYAFRQTSLEDMDWLRHVPANAGSNGAKRFEL